VREFEKNEVLGTVQFINLNGVGKRYKNRSLCLVKLARGCPRLSMKLLRNFYSNSHLHILLGRKCSYRNDLSYEISFWVLFFGKIE
jgi:hypothetical protein